ncbi:hypothetical protein DSLASN_46480 [Desulfoluna limicola]|uniref:Uncharacterized protein n=1 Tax=Desulfoluna limicola TaxID=2810562 RepID=A0ABM7PP06_9BACT|nr:hypothetical protein DSLASN_46480 [Desulfoluna limicola]
MACFLIGVETPVLKAGEKPMAEGGGLCSVVNRAMIVTNALNEESGTFFNYIILVIFMPVRLSPWGGTYRKETP